MIPELPDLFPPNREPVDRMERELRKAVTLAPTSAKPEAVALLVEYCQRTRPGPGI